MIKNEEEYHKIYNLLIVMEDMFWLSSNVENSMKSIDQLPEVKAIKDALDIVYDNYNELNKSVTQWEGDNNIG